MILRVNGSSKSRSEKRGIDREVIQVVYIVSRICAWFFKQCFSRFTSVIIKEWCIFILYSHDYKNLMMAEENLLKHHLKPSENKNNYMQEIQPEKKQNIILHPSTHILVHKKGG